ncbi:hypothetical protein [Parvibaculum sp.]|jgi:hypothetical protein|uniref:hypothetical protein n=1 Tax=Parvibaculum sp. TaxID=2024848 RepID=UPI0025CF2B75|nr:hypothetical protein [Parvibaculum sp.]|tara:strand:- start:2274 stop:2450 length:177 start_codon:yes stop_codon:yes gene_type:complete
MKLFRLTRLKMTASAAILALGAGSAAFFMSTKPVYACSPGGGGAIGSWLDFLGGLLGW